MSDTTETTVAAEANRMMQNRLTNLIEEARRQVELASDPRFAALLETTSEVLTGLRSAYQHQARGQERAWRQ